MIPSPCAFLCTFLSYRDPLISCGLLFLVSHFLTCNWSPSLLSVQTPPLFPLQLQITSATTTFLPDPRRSTIRNLREELQPFPAFSFPALHPHSRSHRTNEQWIKTEWAPPWQMRVYDYLFPNKTLSLPVLKEENCLFLPQLSARVLLKIWIQPANLVPKTFHWWQITSESLVLSKYFSKSLQVNK